VSLYNIIKAVQDAPTKGGGKVKVLEAHKHDPLLRQYLKAVYDPRVNYYTRKLPKEVGDNGVDRDLCADDLHDMQEMLAERRVTGKAATAFLKAKMQSLNWQGCELLGYIIGRDIRAGVAESTILSVFPGLFYVPPYQRCASMTVERKERFAQMPYFYVQTKSDGQFCYAINRKESLLGDPAYTQAMSRAGSLYPQWLAEHITQSMPKGYVAMGELLIVRMGVMLDRKTGNGILNSILSGDGSEFNPDTDSVRYLTWDMVTEEEFDAGYSDRDYELRYHDLCTRTGLARVPSWVVGSLHAANKLQAEHVARGEEGTVWKSPKMKWRDCSSGDKDMMKAKLVFEADFKITGAYEVEGKYKGMLGGFNLASSDDLIQFDCGSGFSDKQREEFWKLVKTQGVGYFLNAVVTAEGNSIESSKSKPGIESVYLPIFIEIRSDKWRADSKERVWEQFNAAKEGRSANANIL